MKKIDLRFLPFLLFYLLIVVMVSTVDFQGDESGYVSYAIRLSQGKIFSSTEITLWWGPGYPIILTPFVFLRIPLLFAKLLNAFLLYGALLYFYGTLVLWVSKPHAIIFTFVLGLYPPFLREVYRLYSESLVFFLVCGFMYHFLMLYRESKAPLFHLVLASAFLGYLALTKVFFGYLIAVGLLTFLVVYLWKRKEQFKKMTLLYFLALVWCIPYLLYTYSLTNKIFYWGTSGGMSLYWMSTPYKNELGDWFSIEEVRINPELSQHKEFFDKLINLSEVEVDNEFKRQALINISHYPTKYLRNWVANIGRLLFSYPFSYTQQKITTFFYLIPNMFIVVLFILSIYPAIIKWKSIPFEIFALLYFNFVGFLGTSLLSAYDRQFRPFVPALLFWIAFIYTQIIIIQLRLESKSN